MEKQIIKDFVNKLSFSNNTVLIGKSLELYNKLRSKGAGDGIVNDNARIIICIEIAAEILNESFNTNHAVQLTGMRRNRYIAGKKTVQKLLNLEKSYDIQGICIALEVNNVNVQKRAAQLLNEFAKVMQGQGVTDNDLKQKPHYCVIAIAKACKEFGVKISKQKMLAVAESTSRDWTTLEKIWEENIIAVEKKPSVTKISSRNSKKNIIPIVDQVDIPTPMEEDIVEEHEPTKSEIAKANAEIFRKAKHLYSQKYQGKSPNDVDIQAVSDKIDAMIKNGVGTSWIPILQW